MAVFDGTGARVGTHAAVTYVGGGPASVPDPRRRWLPRLANPPEPPTVSATVSAVRLQELLLAAAGRWQNTNPEVLGRGDRERLLLRLAEEVGIPRLAEQWRGRRLLRRDRLAIERERLW